jgi:hypothetical protein
MAGEAKTYALSTCATGILPNCRNAPNSRNVLEIRSISLFRSLSAVALAKADAFYKAPVYCQLVTGNWQLYSTIVEKSLQISLFCTNKPNFRKSQMNVNNVLTKDYGKWTLGQAGKTNPIQSQTNPISANKMSKQTQNKPNTNPNKANFKRGHLLVNRWQNHSNIPLI